MKYPSDLNCDETIWWNRPLILYIHRNWTELQLSIKVPTEALWTISVLRKMSHHKISQCLKLMRLGVKMFILLWNWVLRQQCCRDTCLISEWLEHSKHGSCTFKNSLNLMMRYLMWYWIASLALDHCHLSWLPQYMDYMDLAVRCPRNAVKLTRSFAHSLARPPTCPPTRYICPSASKATVKDLGKNSIQ